MTLGGAPSAQTSVQLYEQLQEQGFAAADLQQVRAVLQQATALFAGRVHSSGRSYLSHGIGIASVLARVGAPQALIAAGLLHGAYLRGDFGSWRVFRRWQRPRLSRAVGAEIERLVFHFHELPWNPEGVRALSERATTLTSMERNAVLIRLADDLDNLRDASLLFGADADIAHRSILLKEPSLIALADALGYPALGHALGEAIDAVRDRALPPELRSRIGLCVIPPASGRLRAEAIAARTAAQWFRRARLSLSRMRPSINDRASEDPTRE